MQLKIYREQRHVDTFLQIDFSSFFDRTLQIKDVQKEDKGFYMCQVNTDPMVSTVGFLDVVGEF